MFHGARTVEEVVARYDSAIRYVDEELGRLFKHLEKSGLFRESLLILTSDHGESLGEHGIPFDHHGLYDVTVRVPLILYGDAVGIKGKRVKGLVQHVDLVPTILDILDIPYNLKEFDGFTLKPTLLEEKPINREFIYLEESHAEKKAAIRTREWKYIEAPNEEEALCRYCHVIHGG